MTIIENIEKRIKNFRADLSRYDNAMPTLSNDGKSKIKIIRDELVIRLDELEFVMKLLEQQPVERSPTIICEICGKPFLNIRDNNIYCSIGCRQKAYRSPANVETNSDIKQGIDFAKLSENQLFGMWGSLLARLRQRKERQE